jgi:hypothetical protein
MKFLVQKAALVETHNRQEPANQNPLSPFSKSFISSSKQGGGATVLREGCDTVTRETCVLISFSQCKQLRKMQLCCILPSSVAGAVPNSACWLLGTAVLMSRSHRLFIICSPHLFKNIEGWMPSKAYPSLFICTEISPRDLNFTLTIVEPSLEADKYHD